MPTSIFQQIVLPYLAQSRSIRTFPSSHILNLQLLQSRITHTSAILQRQPESSSSTSTYTRWDYIPPIDKRSFEKGFDPPRQNDGNEGRVVDEEWEKVRKILDNIQGFRRSTINMALEQLAEIQRNTMEQHTESTSTQQAMKEDKAVKLVEAELVQPVKLDQDLQTEQPPPVNWRDLNLTFPPQIYHLLQSRLYKLAVYHLLQSPEYALDQKLLQDVSRHLEKAGAGKLAKRLRNRFSGISDPLSPSTSPDSNFNPYSNANERLPIKHWKLSKHTLSMREINDVENKERREKLLTMFHNTQLSRFCAFIEPPFTICTSSTANQNLSDGRTIYRDYNALHSLLNRIHYLQNRGFRPDWVTANLIVTVWMKCQHHVNGTGTRKGPAGFGIKKKMVQVEDSGMQNLKLLFGYIKNLYEQTLNAQSPPDSQTLFLENGATSTSSTPNDTGISTRTASQSSFGSHAKVWGKGLTPRQISRRMDMRHKYSISYSRHIRPFCDTFKRAFRDRGDRESVYEVVGWQMRMKTILHGATDSDGQ